MDERLRVTRPTAEHTGETVLGRLAALSDPLRLRLLRVLERQELSVGEVSRVLDVPQSTASRHLKVVVDGGWVTRRSAGPAVFHRFVLDELDPGARALWLAVRDELGTGGEAMEDDGRLADVLADRREDPRSFFGRLAGEWDAIRHELFGGQFTSEALAGLLPSDWVVADLGCGTGNASELLSPCVERVIAVDASEAMLEAAGARLGEGANVELVAGDLDALPMGDGSVDAAVCVLVLHHLDEPVVALREARRVLRRERGGGNLLVIDVCEHDGEELRERLGPHGGGFGTEALSAMLGEAGFTDVRVRRLRRAHGVSGPALLAATGRIDSDSD